jgi:branched-chain amino acid transport system substrate-binding protein
MQKMLLSGLVLAAGLAWSGVASADVKIAIAGPITGPNATFGAQLKNGTEQAVEDINAAGGILGQKLVTTLGDDVSDPKQGVSIANKFVGDGVKFVVGHFNSGVTMPASEVYAENGIFEVTPSATNPKVTERGLWNIIRTCGRDDQQGKLWADYAKANLQGKKIAVVHDKTTYGQGLADAAKGFMNGYGIKEVLYEGINAGEKDFSALVSKIKASGAEYIMWGGLHTEGGLIIRQMRDQGLKTVMISGDGITSAEFGTIGGEGVVGTLMSFGPDPLRNPAAKEVIEKFRAKKYEPEAYTLYSYAGVQIIKQAAEKAGSLDPKKVADAIHTGMTFKTVLGDLSYDKKGDRIDTDYVMYTWKKAADGKVYYEQN